MACWPRLASLQTSLAFVTLRRLLKEIEPNLRAGELSTAFVNGCIEDLLEARAELDKLVSLLRTAQKGTHLYVAAS